MKNNNSHNQPGLRLPLLPAPPACGGPAPRGALPPHSPPPRRGYAGRTGSGRKGFSLCRGRTVGPPPPPSRGLLRESGGELSPGRSPSAPQDPWVLGSRGIRWPPGSAVPPPAPHRPSWAVGQAGRGRGAAPQPRRLPRPRFTRRGKETHVERSRPWLLSPTRGAASPLTPLGRVGIPLPPGDPGKTPLPPPPPRPYPLLGAPVPVGGRPGRGRASRQELPGICRAAGAA